MSVFPLDKVSRGTMVPQHSELLPYSSLMTSELKLVRPVLYGSFKTHNRQFYVAISPQWKWRAALQLFKDRKRAQFPDGYRSYRPPAVQIPCIGLGSLAVGFLNSYVYHCGDTFLSFFAVEFPFFGLSCWIAGQNGGRIHTLRLKRTMSRALNGSSGSLDN